MNEKTKKCSECLADIPKEAKKCSHCGSKYKEQYGAKHLILIGLIIFIVIFIIISISSSGDSDYTSTPVNYSNTTDTEKQITREVKSEVRTTQSESETVSEESDSPSFTETTPNNEQDVVIAQFRNGTHVIGKDIEAGIYRSQGTDVCYWARLSGFGRQIDDIIGNGNNAPEIVEIEASDAAFETSGCGKWILVENTLPITPTDSFTDGTFFVGGHIESGTYKADGSPDKLCYWARLSNFSHDGISGIITNGNLPTVVQISSNDKGFASFGCGTWTKI